MLLNIKILRSFLLGIIQFQLLMQIDTLIIHQIVLKQINMEI
jgi:hypothetical protein